MTNNVYTSKLPASLTTLPSLQYLYVKNVDFERIEHGLDFLIGMPVIFKAWMDGTFLGAGATMPTKVVAV